MPRLGRSELDVYPLALGGNTFGWTTDEPTSHTILDAFVDQGGSFIDTADSYTAWIPGNSGGESEAIIGSWLAARNNRDAVVLATKVGSHPDHPGVSPAQVTSAADASLARLGTDYIDLYFAHRDDPDTPLEETVAAFDALVTAGKVRYVALSNYTAERIEQWIDIATRHGYAVPVALQPHYNLVHRTDYENSLAPVAEANNLGAVPYFSLASGFLTGKYRTRDALPDTFRGQLASGYFGDEALAVIDELDAIAHVHNTAVTTIALAWLRDRPGVVAPIASARTLEQLPDLMASAELNLSAAETARLDEVSARIRTAGS